MLIAFDYMTSRSFWRLVYPASRTLDHASPTPPLDRFTSNAKAIRQLAPTWATPEFLSTEDGKLHVLTFARDSRRVSQMHQARAWPHRVPQGSFFDLGTGVYIASPEFCFLLTAASHSLVETIAYGNELCGTYSFDPLSKRGMRERLPLSTVARIERFIEGAQSLPGYHQAKRAIPYLVELSASPMETTTEMLACLPYRLGGYCLKKPDMNYPVELEGGASCFVKTSTCYIDLYWRNHDIAIEYQGKYDHTEDGVYDADRARINALREMDIDVIELTVAQIKGLATFEQLIKRVAKKTKKRLEKEKLGPTPARIALRDELFTWNKNYGRRK